MKCIKRFLALACCLVLVLAGGIKANAAGMSTPRLIITGYDTSPGTVKAGEEFEMTIHLKNTSKRTAVSNIKLTFSSADNEFVAVDGASTVYIERIDSEAEMDVTVKLRARSDLNQKPYILTVASAYEDRYYNPYEETTNLSIQVTQDAKLSVTELSVSPEVIGVGDKSNIMFSINNQGKMKLYNVNVTLSGEGIEDTTTFIGNIDTGMTGYFDANVKATAKNDGAVKAKITYEDSEGKIGEITQDIQLSITEQETADDTYAVDVVVNESAEGSGNMGMILAVVAVIAVVVVVIVVKRKHRKDEEDEIS